MAENDIVIINAFIAALVAGISSYISYIFASRKAEKDARRDYEYEARKQLYKNYQPLVFQFHQLCESAYGRACDLAKNLREKKTTILKDNTYITNTVYRIVAPLAIYRLMERSLTNFDLELDKEIKNEFLFAKALYNAFRNEKYIFNENKASLYALDFSNGAKIIEDRTHALHSSQLDKMTEFLIDGKDENCGQIRIKNLTEFTALLALGNGLWDKKNGSFHRIFRHMKNISNMTDQVFWINLLGYAYICRAICSISDKSPYQLYDELKLKNYPVEHIRELFWNGKTENYMSNIMTQSFEQAKAKLELTLKGPFEQI